MDHFGIGAGVEGAVRIYLQSARRTGRTQALLESLKDGDRVIFLNRNHADMFKRLCLDRGLDVECVVSPIKDPGEVLARGVARGRAIFDHCWVEALYEQKVEEGHRLLDFLTNSMSRTKEMKEADRARQERMKWT